MESKNPYRKPGSAQQPAFSRLTATKKVASRQDEQNFGADGKLNPARGEQTKLGDIRSAVSGTSTQKIARMFNDKGEMNAFDKKDALVQAAHLLQNVSRTAGAKFEAEAMDKQARRDVLAAAMKDPTGEGFALVGQELLLPIKELIDYEGFARKMFRVRPLGQGELFRIAKDVRSTAFVVGQDGQSIESRVYGKYIQPSEFKITSFPSVDIEDIYQMNFDVLDRAQDTARQEIERKEDQAAIAIMDRAAQAVNDVTFFSTLNISAFEDVRFQVERHRLIVEKFAINRAELSDIIKTMSSQVDPVTERELILAGYIGNILNAMIITSAGTGVQEVVPAGTMYAMTGAEYMGEMGIRVELFSEPYNKFVNQELVKGWAMAEIVGFGVANAKSIAKGMK
jgi:hypothetical protein